MALPLKAVSAPGKVLLAGGYLVLDRDYTGLVFGLDARIHVVIQPLPTPSGVSLQEIIVKSPQFKDAVWQYGYRQAADDAGVEVTQLDPSRTGTLNRNPFVETTLAYALSYITALTHAPIPASTITILADTAYYSNTPSPSPNNPSSQFANFAVPLHSAHKTGLGSSAALVTSLTAALLAHYLPPTSFSLSPSPSTNTDSNTTTNTTNKSKTHLHNLAQAAHCAAQGKIGSGFDIASAVHGSALYRRFSPSILAQTTSSTPGSTPGFALTLTSLVQDTAAPPKWDTQITPPNSSLSPPPPKTNPNPNGRTTPPSHPTSPQSAPISAPSPPPQTCPSSQSSKHAF
ncbi:ribosomal protein S5 domain 2-like protein [Pseudovirgaria hyperparasitica]|uniref:phosphomevalonate kinase n=1 Tax=Pseudovirgaria hyperparasitica TaxID=470096 RepID=A0A6A6WJ13_9PEZI|nr:ribosomal protein S5 domain 2-like protein [Pseudovirgaria hyperparasitica]KAF2761717.1 ribosomal protein S5 domain 2-like protein [Pseudovirgaria hyperparasitica]